MNEQTLRWDDLRLIRAIAVAGSLSGAGRTLGISHATVFRRLNGVEARLGVAFFDRLRAGYVPTLAGEDAAKAAERIESEVLAVERRLAGRDLKPSGTVRVTTTDTLLVGLLSPILADFREAYPDISLEVALSNNVFNLSKREADVAIRPTAAPPETLIGRRIGTLAQAIYGHADIVNALEEPVDIAAQDWIGPDETMAYRQLDAWMASRGLDRCCCYRADSMMGVLAAVRSGAGVAVLPCYLADGEAGLARIGDVVPELSTDLWLLTHEDIRRATRIRVFLDFIAGAVKDAAPRLSGKTREAA